MHRYHSYVDFDCPTCKVPKGQECAIMPGETSWSVPHKGRMARAWHADEDIVRAEQARQFRRRRR